MPGCHRVVGDPMVAVLGGEAISEFIHIQCADQHSTLSAQALDQHGIGRRCRLRQSAIGTGESG